MEDDRKFLSLPPYLCLAFIHGKDNELLTFCPIEENGEGVVEKNTPDLLHDEDYTIRNCCHGWLILSDAEEIHYSLWSAAESIHLPALPLNPKQEIGYCILTSPPGNSDSMVVLFETTGPSFYYCKVGDQQWTWTEQLVSPELNPVTLDGRILFCNTKGGVWGVWGVGAIDINPDHLAFSFLGLQNPRLNVPWECIQDYLVESNGEIFSFRLLRNADYGWEEHEVIAVQVFKLDVSGKEWERVESFKDRAFFLGSYSFSCHAFSCHATQTGIKGNRVYFQLYNDPTLYVYNMEDGTVLFSMPCPNLSEWYTSFWAIPNLGRLSEDAGGETKTSDPNDAGDEIESKNREIVKQRTIEQGDFDKLPLEILTEIGRCLGWQDYMRFRAVNTRFRLAAPIQRRRKDICLPWLMSWRLGDSIWNFVDVIHEDRYFMTPHKELVDIKALTSYPKRDWCVMFHGKDSIFLWNPFSKKTIPLPNLHLPNVGDHFNCDTYSVAGCSFSSSPDSSESDCTIVVLFNLYVEYRINFINLGGKEWKSYSFKHNERIRLYKDSPLVFYSGAVYFLDEYGNLGIYREVGDEEDGEREGGGPAGEGDVDEPGDDEDGKEAEGHGDEIGDEDGEGDKGEGEGYGDGDEAQDEDGEGEEEGERHEDEEGDLNEDHEVLDHVVLCPCESFHQKFLLECDGKLVSIFVGFLGEWVEIFSLDENDKVWVEVEDLGNHTIFISRFSAFSMVAPPGLQNRIYFPRFYGNNRVVYYSLESMQLHAHGIDEVLEDFYDTTEQLLCGWITPHFLFID